MRTYGKSKATGQSSKPKPSVSRFRADSPENDDSIANRTNITGHFTTNFTKFDEYGLESIITKESVPKSEVTRKKSETSFQSSTITKKYKKDLKSLLESLNVEQLECIRDLTISTNSSLLYYGRYCFSTDAIPHHLVTVLKEDLIGFKEESLHGAIHLSITQEKYEKLKNTIANIKNKNKDKNKLLSINTSTDINMISSSTTTFSNTTTTAAAAEAISNPNSKIKAIIPKSEGSGFIINNHNNNNHNNNNSSNKNLLQQVKENEDTKSLLSYSHYSDVSMDHYYYNSDSQKEESDNYSSVEKKPKTVFSLTLPTDHLNLETNHSIMQPIPSLYNKDSQESQFYSQTSSEPDFFSLSSPQCLSADSATSAPSSGHNSVRTKERKRFSINKDRKHLITMTPHSHTNNTNNNNNHTNHSNNSSMQDMTKILGVRRKSVDTDEDELKNIVLDEYTSSPEFLSQETIYSLDHERRNIVQSPVTTLMTSLDGLHVYSAKSSKRQNSSRQSMFLPIHNSISGQSLKAYIDEDSSPCHELNWTNRSNASVATTSTTTATARELNHSDVLVKPPSSSRSNSQLSMKRNVSGNDLFTSSKRNLLSPHSGVSSYPSLSSNTTSTTTATTITDTTTDATTSSYNTNTIATYIRNNDPFQENMIQESSRHSTGSNSSTSENTSTTHNSIHLYTQYSSTGSLLETKYQSPEKDNNIMMKTALLEESIVIAFDDDQEENEIHLNSDDDDLNLSSDTILHEPVSLNDLFPLSDHSQAYTIPPSYTIDKLNNDITTYSTSSSSSSSASSSSSSTPPLIDSSNSTNHSHEENVNISHIGDHQELGPMMMGNHHYNFHDDLSSTKSISHMNISGNDSMLSTQGGGVGVGGGNNGRITCAFPIALRQSKEDSESTQSKSNMMTMSNSMSLLPFETADNSMSPPISPRVSTSTGGNTTNTTNSLFNINFRDSFESISSFFPPRFHTGTRDSSSIGSSSGNRNRIEQQQRQQNKKKNLLEKRNMTCSNIPSSQPIGLLTPGPSGNTMKPTPSRANYITPLHICRFGSIPDEKDWGNSLGCNDVDIDTLYVFCPANLPYKDNTDPQQEYNSTQSMTVAMTATTTSITTTTTSTTNITTTPENSIGTDKINNDSFRKLMDRNLYQSAQKPSVSRSFFSTYLSPFTKEKRIEEGDEMADNSYLNTSTATATVTTTNHGNMNKELHHSTTTISSSNNNNCQNVSGYVEHPFPMLLHQQQPVNESWIQKHKTANKMSKDFKWRRKTIIQNRILKSSNNNSYTTNATNECKLALDHSQECSIIDTSLSRIDTNVSRIDDEKDISNTSFPHHLYTQNQSFSETTSPMIKISKTRLRRRQSISQSVISYAKMSTPNTSEILDHSIFDMKVTEDSMISSATTITNDIQLQYENNFLGTIIGGRYQHCFDGEYPVVLPPNSTDKRIIYTHLYVGDHLEIHVYESKIESTEVIIFPSQGWHCHQASPNGYLLSEQPFNMKYGLYYYLHKHPQDLSLQYVSMVDTTMHDSMMMNTASYDYIEQQVDRLSHNNITIHTPRMMSTDEYLLHETTQHNTESYDYTLKNTGDSTEAIYQQANRTMTDDTQAMVTTSTKHNIRLSHERTHIANVNWNHNLILSLIFRFLDPKIDYISIRCVNKTWSLALSRITINQKHIIQEIYSTASNWIKCIQQYPLGSYLNSGACKDVYCIQSKAAGNSQRLYALGIIDLNELQDRDMDAITQYELEVSLLCSQLVSLHICPNIIQMHAVYRSHYPPPSKKWFKKQYAWDRKMTQMSKTLDNSMSTFSSPLLPHFTSSSSYPTQKQFESKKGNYQYIRMEFCHGGDVEEYIRQEQTININTLKILLFQMCYALYCTRDQLTLRHFDIKLLNFFITPGTSLLSSMADFRGPKSGTTTTDKKSLFSFKSSHAKPLNIHHHTQMNEPFSSTTLTPNSPQPHYTTTTTSSNSSQQGFTSPKQQIQSTNTSTGFQGFFSAFQPTHTTTTTTTTTTQLSSTESNNNNNHIANPLPQYTSSTTTASTSSGFSFPTYPFMSSSSTTTSTNHHTHTQSPPLLLPSSSSSSSSTIEKLILQIGFESYIYDIPLSMNSYEPQVIKLADFGTSTVNPLTLGDFITEDQYTTLENTPPEYLFMGSTARQAYSADTFCLGLSFLHLLTGRDPYEVLLKDIKCPPYLMKKLSAIWEKNNHIWNDYNVIYDVIESLDDSADINHTDEDLRTRSKSQQPLDIDSCKKVFYHTIYRYMVLLSYSSALPLNPSPNTMKTITDIHDDHTKSTTAATDDYTHNEIQNNLDRSQIGEEHVWRHNRIYTLLLDACGLSLSTTNHTVKRGDKYNCRVQFQEDTKLWSIERGNHHIMKEVRERLNDLGSGSRELLYSMLNFDPNKRCTMYEALQSPIFHSFRSTSPTSPTNKDWYQSPSSSLTSSQQPGGGGGGGSQYQSMDISQKHIVQLSDKLSKYNLGNTANTYPNNTKIIKYMHYYTGASSSPSLYRDHTAATASSVASLSYHKKYINQV